MTAIEAPNTAFPIDAWEPEATLTPYDIEATQCGLDVRDKKFHPGLVGVSTEELEAAIDAIHAAAIANHPRGRVLLDASARLALDSAGDSARAFPEPMQVSDRQLQLYVQGLDIQEQRTSAVPVRDALAECDQAILDIEMTLESAGRPDLIV